MIKCKEVFIFTGCGVMCFIQSIITSILVWESPERLRRNAIHIPWGFSGMFISKFNIHYGFIYFTMICLYQLMEQIEHLYLQSSDKSWYDMEGYILGFSYGVLYLVLSDKNKQQYESLPLNPHRRSESL
jgi:hypothetical protein